MQALQPPDAGCAGLQRDPSSSESLAGRSAGQPSTSNREQAQGAKPKPQPVPCPRCKAGPDSVKFAYWNNANSSQPRFFCKACQRYWTEGGTLRNVPVGAGRRKNSKAAAREGDAKHAAGVPTTAPAAVATPPLVPFPQLMPDAVLLSALGAPAAAAAPAELRAPCGAAEPRADPAEHVRRVRPRLEPLPAVGESLWPASGEAGPAFGEWASMAVQQQLQQHAALQAAAFGQAQLMGAGWGAGGNPYLPLWPYMYGGPSWAAYAGLGMQSWGSMELGNGAATSAAMAEAGFAGAPQPAGGAAPAFAWPGGMPPAWPAWPAPAHAAAPHGKAGAGGPEASRTTGSSMLSGGSGASALTVGVAQLGSWRPSHSVDTAG